MINNTVNSEVKGHIARRFILLIIAFSSLMTLIATGIQLYNEYEDDVKQINSRVTQVFTSSLLGISETVWVADEEQLNIMLGGIVELPDIIYAEVIIDGETYLESGEKTGSDFLAEQAKLEYQYRGRKWEIGTLKIIASLDGVYQRLMDRVWVILISNGVKTFLMAIFIYFIFVNLVTSRLQKLANFVSGVRLKQFKEKTNLPELPVKHNQDEIDAVASAFNQMQAELQRSFIELSRYRDHLEELVSDRTAELYTSNQELEAFCYSVSHDLRSPLRGINGFAKFLAEEYSDKLDDEGNDYLNRIRSNANNMGSLIDALLNLSRISRKEIEVEPLNLTDITHHCMESLTPTDTEIQIRFDCQDDMTTNGDAKMLAVVMDNLLSNAFKYSQNSVNPSIECGSIKKEGNTVFFVRDNGVGFDIEFEDKIYEPFQRLHGKEFEGTGIGLATVQRIIRRHQGRIWAESAPGKGSTFYFTLFDLPGE